MISTTAAGFCRYRKKHLFLEAGFTPGDESDDTALFTTDFGVTFTLQVRCITRKRQAYGKQPTLLVTEFCRIFFLFFFLKLYRVSYMENMTDLSSLACACMAKLSALCSADLLRHLVRVSGRGQRAGGSARRSDEHRLDGRAALPHRCVALHASEQTEMTSCELLFLNIIIDLLSISITRLSI